MVLTWADIHIAVAHSSIAFNLSIMFLRKVLGGICSTLSISSSELYRYPYRSASESFAGDWKRIGKDIEQTMEELGIDGKSTSE